jgi:hypothetical protein
MRRCARNSNFLNGSAGPRMRLDWCGRPRRSQAAAGALAEAVVRACRAHWHMTVRMRAAAPPRALHSVDVRLSSPATRRHRAPRKHANLRDSDMLGADRNKTHSSRRPRSRCTQQHCRSGVLTGYSRGTHGVLAGYSRGTAQPLHPTALPGITNCVFPDHRRHTGKRQRARDHRQYATCTGTRCNKFCLQHAACNKQHRDNMRHPADNMQHNTDSA